MSFRIFALLAVLIVSVAAITPPFLAKAPVSKQQEFEKLIVENTGLTDQEVEHLVKEWISIQDPAIQDSFAEFQRQKEIRAEMEKRAHETARTKFSPAAKEVDSILTAIANDRTLPVTEKMQRLETIMTALPPKIFEEIQSAMSGRNL